jgi:NAD(P)-dependent dehydrogenase (short-subunit alcohol dehydrogenase family)
MMNKFAGGGSAVVVGASGGIGAALVAALLEEPAFDTVFALSRRFTAGREGRLQRLQADVTDETSLAAAAAALSAPVRLVIVATGILHSGGLQPEKTYRALDAVGLLESYRVNVVGPALVAKHMLPLLDPGRRSVFAALSARVGSIGDNRAGGWHGYRASKAALNMIIRNLAIETARRTPETLCIGLHPGTVDTALSQPFQRNVAPGKLFAATYSAGRLLSVIDGLTPADSGNVLAWDGSTVPP